MRNILFICIPKLPLNPVLECDLYGYILKSEGYIMEFPTSPQFDGERAKELLLKSPCYADIMRNIDSLMEVRSLIWRYGNCTKVYLFEDKDKYNFIFECYDD